MRKQFQIRPFQLQDLPALLVIRDKVLTGRGWSAEDYRRLAQEPGGLILVAENGLQMLPEVVGFAASRQAFGQVELLNLSVHPAYQRCGIGRALLEAVCERVQERGARSVYLEVRASNQAALGLYHSAGFNLHSIRKDYYSYPPEDAWVLSLALG